MENVLVALGFICLGIMIGVYLFATAIDNERQAGFERSGVIFIGKSLYTCNAIKVSDLPANHQPSE